MSELDGSRKGPPKPPKPMPLPSGRASRTNITERESPVTTSEREENKPALIFSLDKSKEKNQSYVKKNKFLSPEHWETKKRETVSSMLSPGQEESRIDLSGCGSTNDLSPSVQKKNHERIDMYHNTHFGVQWAYLTISLHVLQFGLLLPLGFEALSTASLVPLLLLSTAVPGLVLVARYCTHKQPKSVDWSYLSIKSPQQETDGVPDRVVLLLSLAALLEGGAYALFSVATTGEHSRGDLSGRGVKSFDTITQVRAVASRCVACVTDEHHLSCDRFWASPPLLISACIACCGPPTASTPCAACWRWRSLASAGMLWTEPPSTSC